MHTLKIGDKVKLTGKFLKATGQGRGGEGCKVWTVIGFWERSPDMVIVDEPNPFADMFSPEELLEPSCKYRSFAAANIYKVGTLTERNCP